MTPYTRQDLSENWEFKIIRSSTGAFKNPEKMRAVLEEEGRAGWVLVEKFDNSRMRLKRPHDARSADAGLGYLIAQSRGLFDTATLFVALLALMILALLFYTSVAVIERALLNGRRKE